MRDEDYRPDQLPSYGAVGQPAAVARLSRHLWTVKIGQVVATFALATAVLALILYGDGWSGFGGGWFVALVVLAGLLDVACLVQLLAWLQASAAWSGRARMDSRKLRARTWVVQIAAYVITALALVAGVVAIVEAGWNASASIAVLVTLVAMCVALVLAGIQYVHRSGPPGAAPSHMRTVVARQNLRRSPDQTRASSTGVTKR